MIENWIDAGLTLSRLRSAVEDASLRGWEVEALVGLAPGRWNGFIVGRPLAAMTPLQETRARLTLEMIVSMGRLLGCIGYVGEWLRAPAAALDGQSPLSWTTEDLAYLRAVVRAIRNEVHG